MPGPFVERYRGIAEALFGRPFSDKDGVPGSDLDGVPERAGYELPEALYDFYAVLGNCADVTEPHNRFYRPGGFDRRDGKLIFCEENQAVVYWGYDADQGWAADPPVYQGVNGDTLEWFVEDGRCSAFLAGMIYWQALNGGLPHSGFASATDAVYRAAANWPLVWQDEDTQLFSRGSAVFGLTRRESEIAVDAAGLSESDLTEVGRVLGVKLL
ncbi:MAG: hypothetical protein J0I06_08770 [Planctomycetes bacterium]|nr:hypothetical protein [Planctomycetota bacterium]